MRLRPLRPASPSLSSFGSGSSSLSSLSDSELSDSSLSDSDGSPFGGRPRLVRCTSSSSKTSAPRSFTGSPFASNLRAGLAGDHRPVTAVTGILPSTRSPGSSAGANGFVAASLGRCCCCVVVIGVGVGVVVVRAPCGG